VSSTILPSGSSSIVPVLPVPSLILPTTGLTPSQLPQVSPSNHSPPGAVFSVPDVGIGAQGGGHGKGNRNGPPGKH
jgi:hypothetical protein